MKFDESNSSTVGQVDLIDVGDEYTPSVAIKRMTIGNILPREVEEEA